MNSLPSPAVDIAHLIQVALTPIFLISAIGVILNVLTSRLARIVDRARAMEEKWLSQEGRELRSELGETLHRQLEVLAHRSLYINVAITLIIVSALLISLVVVMLFVNAFLRWDLPELIAILFISSMLSLAAALLAFLIEVSIATHSLRIGILAASPTRPS